MKEIVPKPAQPSAGAQTGSHVEPSNPPCKGFIREPAVLKIFPVSRSTWWDGIRKGIYPKPYRLSPRAVAWRIEDIEKLLKEVDHA